jgi:hypothetical protein
MAGSYAHTVDDDGKLLGPLNMRGMLENSGDVYEAIEELYGMIWFLAEGDPLRVTHAQRNYRAGLDMSPGVADDD